MHGDLESVLNSHGVDTYPGVAFSPEETFSRGQRIVASIYLTRNPTSLVELTSVERILVMPITLSLFLLDFSRGLWWFMDYNGDITDGSVSTLGGHDIFFLRQSEHPP